MEYHYVKHHQLNARGEPVLNETDTHKLSINLNAGPTLNHQPDKNIFNNQTITRSNMNNKNSDIFGQYRDINRNSLNQLQNFSTNENLGNKNNFDNLNVHNLDHNQSHTVNTDRRLVNNNYVGDDFSQSPGNMNYSRMRDTVNLHGGSPNRNQMNHADGFRY